MKPAGWLDCLFETSFLIISLGSKTSKPEWRPFRHLTASKGQETKWTDVACSLLGQERQHLLSSKRSAFIGAALG